MRRFNPQATPIPHLEFAPEHWRKFRHLDVEIGAGQGLHAIRYCQAYPDRHLLALERTENRFQKLKIRQHNHPEIRNLTCIRSDAVNFMTHALPDASVDQVFLLYPNPYPKAKQANLRWHNMPFLAQLKRKLKPGAKLTVATNVEFYFKECREQMTQAWGFNLLQAEKIPSEFNPRTHFEKKYLERKQSCWNLVFHHYNN